ncbi:unnamed protein product [Urochloa decumbens]|uniref:Uncharacterized protein n=1 Tax=Urochloa decumbens TaxID=240449 RepID=A0ABC9E2U0_9POAL
MDATVASSPAGSAARIYGPSNFEDEFRIAKTQDEIKPVLAKIESIYDEQVHLDDELVADNGGFCFGLLAPATNVLVNTVICAAGAAPPAARGGGNGGRLDMSQRSLDGLIAFLICLFPYLPDAEALSYLDAADADPLAAALLVIRRRGLRRFGFDSGTAAAAVEAALGCAAAAANHPDPRRPVLGWKLLSRSLSNNVIIAGTTRPGAAVLCGALAAAGDGTSSAELHLTEPWKLAGARLDDIQIPNKDLLPPVRAAAKRKLLATIHGMYLNALARLPAAELRGRHHRGVLAGGGCYGPLDPVSNIIVNAVMYDQTFPARKQVTLDMVSTACLWRAAARSLYGLVSFLCTRYPSLTPDQAVHRLQFAGADLRIADPNLFDDVGMKQGSSEEEQSTPATGAGEAYAAAAAAALHPSPLAQKELLGSPDGVSRIKAAAEKLRLQDGRMLSSEDLEFLSMVLPKCPSSDGESQQQVPTEPVKVRKRVYARVSECSSEFWGKHERARRMVAAALDKFNETAVPKYSLHVICGVNELVCGPEVSLEDMGIRGYNPWTRHQYRHSHINFLATCEGTQCAGAPATLFFAECSNHRNGTCWCAPVSPPHPDAEQVRCIYCEHQGVRVVHPDDRNFHGRDEFEKLFYGLEREIYSNDKIVARNRIVDQVHDVEDDAIYLNYCIDDDDCDEDDFMELHIS